MFTSILKRTHLALFIFCVIVAGQVLASPGSLSPLYCDRYLRDFVASKKSKNIVQQGNRLLVFKEKTVEGPLIAAAACAILLVGGTGVLLGCDNRAAQVALGLAGLGGFFAGFYVGDHFLNSKAPLLLFNDTGLFIKGEKKVSWIDVYEIDAVQMQDKNGSLVTTLVFRDRFKSSVYQLTDIDLYGDINVPRELLLLNIAALSRCYIDNQNLLRRF